MLSLLTLLLASLASLAFALRTRTITSPQLSCSEPIAAIRHSYRTRMSSSDDVTGGRSTNIVDALRLVRVPIATFISAASLFLPDVALGASVGVSGAAALEQAITRLEQVDNRGDTVQAMADLYEVVQAKPLLTRTKYKYRVVNAINDKHRLLSNEWDQTLSYEVSELKRAADPFRTVDLKPYLQVAPYIGGGLYLITLFIQRKIPEIFNFAYPLSVFVLVSPVIFILLTT